MSDDKFIVRTMAPKDHGIEFYGTYKDNSASCFIVYTRAAFVNSWSADVEKDSAPFKIDVELTSGKTIHLAFKDKEVRARNNAYEHIVNRAGVTVTETKTTAM